MSKVTQVQNVNSDTNQKYILSFTKKKKKEKKKKPEYWLSRVSNKAEGNLEF